MFSKTDSVEMMVLITVVLAFIALLAYVTVFKSKIRREKKNTAAISVALIDYFRRTGVEVSVECVSLKDGKRFTAFIESEPMKRFRLSHIIEMTLRDHVSKTCGLELEKVYWRFPIKEATRTDAAKDAKAVGADDYINEGLVHYRDLPKFEVTEIPWEKFEEVSAKDGEEKPNAEAS